MRRRSDIAGLGATQIVGYGTLYYGFSVVAPSMATDLGWSREWIFGAFSVALLVGGVAAPTAGRLIDRHGAGRMMSLGSVLAAIALAAAAAAPNGPVAVAALIATQIAAVLVQYGAAFPLVVQRQGTAARRGIVHLTLIAGFASTLFWPATAWLAGSMSWRSIFLVFAALHLVVCLPVHLLLSRPAAADAETGSPSHGPPPLPVEGRLPATRRRLGFRLMVLAIALQSLLSAALLVHMLAVLGALGLGDAAVMVGMLFGPAQVASRFVNMVFGRNLSQSVLAVISAALLPAATLLLLATAPSLAGALVFAVLFGMGNGLYSIVGGTLPLELFGVGDYGARQGRVTSARLVAGAIAPFVFSLATAAFGVPWALALSALAGSGAVVALVAIRRLAAAPQDADATRRPRPANSPE